MKKLLRSVLFSLTCLALILLVFAGNSLSQGAKNVKSVDAIADALEKGDLKAADKLAEDLAKKEGEVYYIMLLLKDRAGKKPGVGVGPNPGAIMPDGIESKIRAIAAAPLNPQQLQKESKELARMAYRVAAVAKFSEYLPPKKAPAKWGGLAKDNFQSSMDLAKHIQAQDFAKVNATVAKINATCNNCHSDYR